MPGPTLTFGFIVATLLGAIFHLVLGGDVRRLALFLLSGWVGFAAGHLAGSMFNVKLIDVGALHFFSAVVGALVALILAHAVTSKQINRRSTR